MAVGHANSLAPSRSDPAAGDVHHVESGSPHEFVLVDQLLPGRWLVVAVRVRPGAAFAGGAVAGGEPRPAGFATAPAQVASGMPVVIHASVRWRHRAVVTVMGSPSAMIADPIGRLSHSETGATDTDPGAPSFVREVVVSVDVGDRGEPGEWEEEPSLDRPHRPRPVELVSALLTRLADT